MIPPQFAPARMGRGLPNWKPTNLFERIIPMLRDAGVGDKSITTMLDENPARWFDGLKPASAG